MNRGGGRRKLSPEAKLQAIYAQVPDAGCKGLCERSCSSISMTPQEQRRIFAATGRRMPLFATFATNSNPDGRCPALTDGRCGIYRFRPHVCRVWGAVESIPCPFGCVPDGGPLPLAEEQRLADELLRLGGMPPEEAIRRAGDSLWDRYQ